MVRERCRDLLMGLRPEQAPLLREAVSQFLPLAADQLLLLKDIVFQIYLSDADYETDGSGFIGILMPSEPEPLTGRLTVAIDSRIRGFGGYHTLRDGDVILDVLERRLPPPLDREMFIRVVQMVPPGRVIHLRVLRMGRVIEVPVQVRPRPAERTEGLMRELMYRRDQEAERFFLRHFGAMLGEEQRAPIEAGPRAGK